jgi:putative DNA primase/helicase
MGPLAGAIRAEMLLDQGRVANSAGPTPDIMALRGLRMAFASEFDQGSRFSPSRVKWLTGNDRLTGRNPHDKYETQFSPTHTLFLLTNNEPQAPPDDFAFWERVFLVPFDVSFVDREPKAANERRSDPTLPAKLRQEYPGILAWLVRGCLYYQRDGLAPPRAVREATDKYKSDLDSVTDFLEVCLDEEETAETGATLLYEVFAQWWDDNVGTKCMSQKRFGTIFGKRYPKKKKPEVCYTGVRLTAKGFAFLDQANEMRERKGKKILTIDDGLTVFDH